MAEARRIASFAGGVSCRSGDDPWGLTLVGRSADQPTELITLAFVTARVAIPEALEDVTVEQLANGSYSIRSGKRTWPVAARSAHLHREVATAFYQAIAPRPVPWLRRMFWRVVLAAAASSIGRQLLLMLRRP